MKKGISILLAVSIVILMLMASGCSAASNEQINSNTTLNSVSEQNNSDVQSGDEAESTGSNASAQENTASSKVLVVYFSRTGEQYGVGVIDEGNTAIVAKMIAEETSADTFEILPVDDHYPMTYDALTDAAKQEQNEKARPQYQGGVPDLSQYDTVFIGAPVWWGDWPMIMYTFFENEDLSGKTLIPFSTHAGSGLSGFDSKLSTACPDSTVLDGLAVAGSDAQNNREKVKEDVIGWLTEIKT